MYDRRETKSRRAHLSLDRLERSIVSGHVEVDDLIRAAVAATTSDAARFQRWSDIRKVAEADSRKRGLRPIPLSTWLDLAARYCVGGYESLEQAYLQKRAVLPYVLGFCEADRSSPAARQLLHRLAGLGSEMGARGRKQLLLSINAVFSFAPVDCDRYRKMPAIHDFIATQLERNEHLGEAMCAARGFPSARILRAVEDAPEPREPYKGLRATLLARLRSSKV